MQRVTVDSTPLKPLKLYHPHGDKKFAKAAKSSIKDLIEVQDDFYIPNCGNNGVLKWAKKLDKLHQLSTLDKQAFIFLYLKIIGCKYISDIDQPYFDLLEAQGEIKSRSTWPKGF